MSSSTGRAPRPRRVPFPLFETDESNAPAVAVPANHFLAQRAVTPPAHPDAHQSEGEGDWLAGARPDTSSLAAADYDVSVVSGFLPPDEPVQRLGGEWEAYELLLERAQGEVRGLSSGGVGRIGHQWRQAVEELPIASISGLTTLPLLRRGHVLLSFLAHFYIHSCYPYLNRVPRAIAVPWTQISDKLGVPPVLSYADTVLWNWHMVDKSRGLSADNLAITTTFTSTPSESAFFLLSLFCELYGPIVLRLMSSTLDEAFFADAQAVARIGHNLVEIAGVIDGLSDIMVGGTKGAFGPGLKARIVPEVFYWGIRPWFNGGAWVYEGAGVGGADVAAEWGGPSAGQSSLVHAIDLFLGVDHSPRAPPATGNTAASSAAAATATGSAPALAVVPSRSLTVKVAPSPMTDDTFMARASAYMPSHHRFFLHHLASLHSPSPAHPDPVPSVRALAQRHQGLLEAHYDTAVRAMKRFRDDHMKLVAVFIISQARRAPPEDSVFWDEFEARRVEQEREAAREAERVAGGGERKVEKMMGTGGTDLVTFLKATRDRTTETLLAGGRA